MSEPPVKKLSSSRGVHVAIWANETSVGVRHSVSLSRSYKDRDEWKQSQFLGRDELLIAAKLLDQAHTWILETEAATSKGESDD